MQIQPPGDPREQHLGGVRQERWKLKFCMDNCLMPWLDQTCSQSSDPPPSVQRKQVLSLIKILPKYIFLRFRTFSSFFSIEKNLVAEKRIWSRLRTCPQKNVFFISTPCLIVLGNNDLCQKFHSFIPFPMYYWFTELVCI